MTNSNSAGPGATGTGLPELDAVLFDMDGVVTDTADAHAAAWKRLFDEFLQEWASEQGEPHGETIEPFDIDADYRRHVDGKPRYDGVAGFLEARGIELPRGDPADAPDRRTVCGLGNRKDGYFRDWLSTHQARSYPSTVALIERLRAAGIRVAVFSASRNCQAVLSSAGVRELFDARVDGDDLLRLDLPGKPDPAMLREAANRLGSRPERTAVIEDSVAGVRAGAAGGFGPVIGVDRGEYGEVLAKAGADIVVRDPGELVLDPDRRLQAKSVNTIPSAGACLEALRRRMRGRTPAIFLDYDGTLTPIVADPAAAALPEPTRAVLNGLAAMWPVAIISGRALTDLRARVAVDGIVYAGSHGFELAGPGFERTAEHADEFLPELDAAEAALRKRLGDIEGHAVERKPFAIAVHFRRVADSEVGRLEHAVDRVLSEHARLRKGRGKKVFQVQPRLDWNKGRAVSWLLRRLELDEQRFIPLYIGDDLTDEDAFRALSGRGIGIALRDRDDRTTAADYALDDPDEVRRFLERLQEQGGSG